MSKRVLVISHYIPHSPGSGSPVREFCLARELADEYEITYLLPLYSETERTKAEVLSRFCDVRLYSPHLARTPLGQRLDYSLRQRLPKAHRLLHHMMRSPMLVQQLVPLFPALEAELHSINLGSYDLVQVSHVQLARPVARMQVGTGTTLDWHNVYTSFALRQYRQAGNLCNRVVGWLDYTKTRNYELGMVKRFQKSTVVSIEDREVLQRMSPRADISVVPNGVDCRYFSNDTPTVVDPEAIVFTGTMDYEPNIEGVLFFAKQVLPRLLHVRPTVKLYIVGKRPSESIRALQETHPHNVVVTGTVDDVRPFLDRAAVVVVPLLNGGGTRLKILEALAMQKAVVSTSLGAEGLELVDEQDLLIVDGAVAFADATLRLLHNMELRTQIAYRGHQKVVRKYDWTYIAKQMSDAWQGAMEKHSGGQGRL